MVVSKPRLSRSFVGRLESVLPRPVVARAEEPGTTGIHVQDLFRSLKILGQ